MGVYIYIYFCYVFIVYSSKILPADLSEKGGLVVDDPTRRVEDHVLRSGEFLAITYYSMINVNVLNIYSLIVFVY